MNQPLREDERKKTRKSNFDEASKHNGAWRSRSSTRNLKASNFQTSITLERTFFNTIYTVYTIGLEPSQLDLNWCIQYYPTLLL